MVDLAAPRSSSVLHVEPAPIRDALLRAHANAPFLATLIDRQPALVAELESGRIDLAPSVPADTVPQRLRRERRALALSVAVGDLAGVLDLTAVTGALTAFADRALDAAIAAAIAERTPDAPARGFAAIALGKQGSRELNYSSDIDPILLYDPATLPCRPREEPADAAVRIARRVVEILQARDGDGYVLRVDLRLRPSPEVTPIALPVDAAITYYESLALAWERAAFIRARAAAGDIALGEHFLAAVQPFIWRRALDFGAIAEIRGVSHRIRDHYSAGQVFGPGFDLKRGRGGIREAEFYAQAHQLIHGGRDEALRAPATRDALAALAAAGRIAPEAATGLAEGYELLRTIEHRVQMVDDRQTHALPDGDALDRVARLHGLADGAALLALLAGPVATVARIYEELTGDAPASLPDLAEPLAAVLAGAGFADPEAARARIEAWRSRRYPALRSAAAREALEAALPTIVTALGTAPDPGAALLRLDTLLERLPSAVNLFRLLEAQPALARLLTAILSHAPTLAEQLAQRPALLDGLIDASALHAAPDRPALVAAMRAGVIDDLGTRIEQVARVAGEARFALGAQIVAGTSDPLEVATGYARVADAAIEAVASAVIEEFARAHGRVPESELLVLALGRLGGGAMTHASDLDLVYVFTGDFAAESDGARPLGATLYYNRLAQRLTGALSVQTAGGALYQIDTRLRPSGNQGPLAVSLDSFARYQRESAWTWEHMALTRARPVFGSAGGRAALETVIAGVLAGGRPQRDVVADARAMRAEMAAHKPPIGPLDAKLLPGGLVDLEFAVHAVQLAHRTGFDPDLGRAVDALIVERLLPARTRRAHDFLTRLLVTLRLVAPEGRLDQPATQALVAAAVGLADWRAVLAWLEAERQDVIETWAAVTEDGHD